jgi:hypothetical protein
MTNSMCIEFIRLTSKKSKFHTPSQRDSFEVCPYARQGMERQKGAGALGARI